MGGAYQTLVCERCGMSLHINWNDPSTHDKFVYVDGKLLCSFCWHERERLLKKFYDRQEDGNSYEVGKGAEVEEDD